MYSTSRRSAKRWRASRSSFTRRHCRTVLIGVPTDHLRDTQGESWLLQHLRVSDLLHMLDRNHDGKVSRQELKKWLEGRPIPSCIALRRYTRDYTSSRTFRI